MMMRFGCNQCDRSSASWSFTEGDRCYLHSSYIGVRADTAKELGNKLAAERYAGQLARSEYPNETVRQFMREFVTRYNPPPCSRGADSFEGAPTVAA